MKTQKISDLDVKIIDRIVEMAWEDRTPFSAIESETLGVEYAAEAAAFPPTQFGLKEKEVIALMRREMKPSSFKMWRKRVSGRKTKHLAKRDFLAGRFKSQNQT